MRCSIVRGFWSTTGEIDWAYHRFACRGSDEMLPYRWPTWVRRSVGAFFLILVIIVMGGLMLVPWFGA